MTIWVKQLMRADGQLLRRQYLTMAFEKRQISHDIASKTSETLQAVTSNPMSIDDVATQFSTD